MKREVVVQQPAARRPRLADENDDIRALLVRARAEMELAPAVDLAEWRETLNGMFARLNAQRARLAHRGGSVDHALALLGGDIQHCMGQLRRRIRALNAAAALPVHGDQVNLAVIRRLWVALGVALGELDPHDHGLAEEP